MPLTLLLVECGIELIPDEIKNHPAIQKNLQKENYASRILDNAIHHSAMKKLNVYEKRGRPDITHICLLNALGSPLNISGNLTLYIHTVHNKIFKINPKIRLARNYNRFKGLIGKLLIEGKIETDEDILISSIEGDLKSLLRTIEDAEVILCSVKGRLTLNYQEIFQDNLSKNYVLIIGGFQKGRFSSEILGLSNNLVSISKNSLNAWNVVNKMITYYEIHNNIH